MPVDGTKKRGRLANDTKATLARWHLHAADTSGARMNRCGPK